MFQPFLPFFRKPPSTRPADASLRTLGNHYDLEEVFHRINTRYFGGRHEVAIAWGRGRSRRRRSIHFGSYDTSVRLIRIHPDLDRPEVPLLFLDYVVYHELLHAELGFGKGPSGRRVLHSAEFRRREKQFDDYPSARAWEKANIGLFFKARNHKR